LLIRLQLSGGDCNVTVSGNAERGNVVNYDADEAETVYGGSCFIEQDQCLIDDASTEYDNWEYWDYPPCWCFARQCRGDNTGTKLGPFWVAGDDLAFFKTCLSKLEATLPEGCECADLTHTKLGPFWVAGDDLADLKLYLSKLEAMVPCCDSDQDCVPDNVIYRFWTNP
jgi:hypothetical protein